MFNHVLLKKRLNYVMTIVLIIALVAFMFYLYHEMEKGTRRSGKYFFTLLLATPYILYETFKQLYRMEEAIKEILAGIPDLGGDLDNLRWADYIDEELGFVVYGHYLIHIKTFTIECVNLDDCEDIYINEERRGYGLYKADVTYLHADLRDGSVRKFHLPQKKDVEDQLDELSAYINSLYEEEVDSDVIY